MSFKFYLFLLGLIIVILASLNLVMYSKSPTNTKEVIKKDTWEVRSIDVMKLSRDTARERANDIEYQKEIKIMMSNIAKTHATHVSIGTPYDDEFAPYLKVWVDTARSEGLNVWFRGNFSGWEGWFEYPKITREEHEVQLKEFLVKNESLFKDGDIFSTCPECENGGPGDPRLTGDVVGYRQFLIDETTIANNYFSMVGINVSANYHSMNGDVAKLIMDKQTTAKLGGIVVVDHYVESADQLARDIKEYAKLSGGKVVLGEFGAPIPDLHGNMTEEEQAAWLEELLSKLSNTPELVGLNYWVNKGGSTALWADDDREKLAVKVLRKYYDINSN